MSRAEGLLSSYLNLDKLILMDVRSPRPSSHESRATIGLLIDVIRDVDFVIFGEIKLCKICKMWNLGTLRKI